MSLNMPSSWATGRPPTAVLPCSPSAADRSACSTCGCWDNVNACPAAADPPATGDAATGDAGAGSAGAGGWDGEAPVGSSHAGVGTPMFIPGPENGEGTPG